jgi:acyl carrier protein
MTVSREEILRMVRLQLGKPDVRESDRLMEDLGAESADLANIVATLEERCHVRLSEADVAAVRTVGDLHALVHRQP